MIPWWLLVEKPQSFRLIGWWSNHLMILNEGKTGRKWTKKNECAGTTEMCYYCWNPFFVGVWSRIVFRTWHHRRRRLNHFRNPSFQVPYVSSKCVIVRRISGFFFFFCTDKTRMLIVKSHEHLTVRIWSSQEIININNYSIWMLLLYKIVLIRVLFKTKKIKDK